MCINAKSLPVKIVESTILYDRGSEYMARKMRGFASLFSLDRFSGDIRDSFTLGRYSAGFGRRFVGGGERKSQLTLVSSQHVFSATPSISQITIMDFWNLKLLEF